jgi:hypothetical protein
MASILKVDELQGIISAGDITVTSEGGSATQSLQQGLAKAWVNFNGTGTIASQDSLNLSSLTDNGAGNYTSTFSNALSTDNHSASFYANYSSGWGNSCYEAGRSTTTHQGRVVNNQIAGGGGDDASECSLIIMGDLA